MILRSLALCAAIAAATAGHPVQVDQVARRPAETSRVEQIPAGASDRSARPVALEPSLEPAPDHASGLQASKTPAQPGVDADAIARVLASGRASTIDTAAAVAASALAPSGDAAPKAEDKSLKVIYPDIKDLPREER